MQITTVADLRNMTVKQIVAWIECNEENTIEQQPEQQQQFSLNNKEYKKIQFDLGNVPELDMSICPDIVAKF